MIIYTSVLIYNLLNISFYYNNEPGSLQNLDEKMKQEKRAYMQKNLPTHSDL